jgi:hypothetical protein
MWRYSALLALFGIKFLDQAIQLMAHQDIEGMETRMSILRFWLILYAFVGT